MKYFKTYEAFKKDYMKKIDLKDFKKIKKGSKIMYMGGKAEVLDNNGFVLKLKGEDGKTFTVNKSMFDHGGMIKEGIAQMAKKAYMTFKKHFKKSVFSSGPSKLFNIVEPSDTDYEAAEDWVKMNGAKGDKIYMTGTDEILNKIHIAYGQPNLDIQSPEITEVSIDRPQVNEASSEKDGTKASDGKHKHEDHLEEDMEAMWKKAYGENFTDKYPGVAKIIKQRKIKDPREIARIWQETYGEDFEKEYPVVWDMLSK